MELKKKREGVARTQAFLAVIDECTRTNSQLEEKGTRKRSRGITVGTTTHPTGNGQSGRLLRVAWGMKGDIRTDHTLGCSPQFVVYGAVPIQEPGIAAQLISKEKPLAAEERDQYR